MIEYRTQSQVFDHLACFRNLEFDFCEGTMPAGMINFTRYLANRYGKKGVRANCLSPGGYLADRPEPFLKKYRKRCPLRRMAENDDIKRAVVFLASDASAYITGTNLMVDGGWTAL